MLALSERRPLRLYGHDQAVFWPGFALGIAVGRVRRAKSRTPSVCGCCSSEHPTCWKSATTWRVLTVPFDIAVWLPQRPVASGTRVGKVVQRDGRKRALRRLIGLLACAVGSVSSTKAVGKPHPHKCPCMVFSAPYWCGVCCIRTTPGQITGEISRICLAGSDPPLAK